MRSTQQNCRDAANTKLHVLEPLIEMRHVTRQQQKQQQSDISHSLNTASP
jgi:hypothetical protein